MSCAICRASSLSILKLLAIIVITGLLIRIVCMPLLTYDYDIYHWGVIIQNIDSGNNLYDLAGYFYTPVWGYILGFISMMGDAFSNVSVMGVTFTDLLPIESLTYRFHISTITTIPFNILMKIPLVIVDIVVGYLIYVLILDRTKNQKKAVYGFGLWFLCPIVIYMSSVQAMFDTFSALLLLLTVLLLYKDKCFLAGLLFGTAFLLKLFPAFCILVLIGYVYVKHKDDGLALKKSMQSIIGTVVMILILLFPQILNDQLGDTLSFIFGRASTADLSSLLFTVFGSMIAISGMIYFGYRMFKTKLENADKALFENVLFSITCAVLMSITPQYIIVILPFLVLYIMTTDVSYRRGWAIVCFSALAGALVLNNFSLLCSLAEYTSLVSPDTIIMLMNSLEGRVFGIMYLDIINGIANFLQFTGTMLIVIFSFAESINKKSPKLGKVILRLKNGRSTDEI